MKVLCKGQEIPTGDITLRVSIFEYSAVLSFSVPALIPTDEFILQIEDDMPFVPVSIERENTAAYRYTCYPKGYWDFLHKVSQPVCLDGDLPTLLDALSLTEYTVLHSTPQAHWVLPSLRGKTLMDVLTKQITAIDGGCPFAYFNVAGGLTWGDVLTECLTDPKGTFYGMLMEDRSSNAYQSAVPGVVHFMFFDEDTFTPQEATFLKDSSEANMFRYVADEDEKRATLAELQSNFWRRKVATTVSKFDDVTMSGITPGLKVINTQTDKQYVLVSYETTWNPSGADNKFELFPSIIPEQNIF